MSKRSSPADLVEERHLRHAHRRRIRRGRPAARASRRYSATTADGGALEPLELRRGRRRRRSAIALRSIWPASSRIRSPKRSSSALRTSGSVRGAGGGRSRRSRPSPRRGGRTRRRASLLPAPMPPVIATATGRATGLLRRGRRLAVRLARACSSGATSVGLDAGVRVLGRRRGSSAGLARRVPLRLLGLVRRLGSASSARLSAAGSAAARRRPRRGGASAAPSREDLLGEVERRRALARARNRPRAA